MKDKRPIISANSAINFNALSNFSNILSNRKNPFYNSLVQNLLVNESIRDDAISDIKNNPEKRNECYISLQIEIKKYERNVIINLFDFFILFCLTSYLVYYSVCINNDIGYFFSSTIGLVTLIFSFYLYNHANDLFTLKKFSNDIKQGINEELGDEIQSRITINRH